MRVVAFEWVYSAFAPNNLVEPVGLSLSGGSSVPVCDCLSFSDVDSAFNQTSCIVGGDALTTGFLLSYASLSVGRAFRPVDGAMKRNLAGAAFEEGIRLSRTSEG